MLLHFFKYKKLHITGPVYLELNLENINCKNVSSSVTVSNEMNIDSIKIFALNDSQQAFILSGPENRDDRYIYSLINVNKEM